MTFNQYPGLSYYEVEADVSNYFFLCDEENNYCCAHYHNSVEVIFVKNGRHAVWINGLKSILEAGDLCVSNSFDIHYYHFLDASSVHIMLISKELMSAFYAAHPGMEFPNILRKVGASSEELEEVFALMQRYRNENLHLTFGLVNTFFGILLKYYPLRSIKKKNNEGIIDVLKYIDKYYADNLTIDSLSSIFSYNKVYFSRMFNTCIGMHFRDYLNRVRLDKLNLMKEVNTKTSIAVMAMACGFESMSTYYRAVKREKESIEKGEL